MPIKITVPKLGSTMTSAFVSKWYKREGDAVKQDEPVVAVETDKISHDVLAQEDGFLLRIFVGEEEEREIGETLGIIGSMEESDA